MNLKAFVGRQLNLNAMRRHRSRIGWRLASTYSSYLDRCRREAPVTELLNEQMRACVTDFSRDAVTSFHTAGTQAVAESIRRRIAEREAAGETVWNAIDDYGGRTYAGQLWQDFPQIEDLFQGDLGRFLRGYFKSPFKIFYGLMYRSIALEDGRQGSQKWHSDGGPGICINVMFYLHDIGPDDGALEVLPWDRSLAIYRGEPHLVAGIDKRKVLSDHYERVIGERYTNEIVRRMGPGGLVVPFLNNTLHRGGYPESGRERTAIVIHCYPSHKPTDFDRYRKKGIAKSGPYPPDPAADF